MKIHVLASGSKGNAVLVEDGRDRILVDAGLSARELERRLGQVGCRLGGDRASRHLQGIFVTHDHGDHVRGLRLFAGRHRIPVYATRGTFAGLGAEVAAELESLWIPIDHRSPEAGPDPDLRVPGCGIGVHPVHSEHDAKGSVGYVFTSSCGRYRAGVATDMGHEGLMLRALRDCNLLVLEFNHDEGMLHRNREYPRSLKERILGDLGHLSNRQASELLYRILSPDRGRRLEALVLAHLSEKNNTPELALAAARAALEMRQLEEGVELKVAGPHEVVSIAVRG